MDGIVCGHYDRYNLLDLEGIRPLIHIEETIRGPRAPREAFDYLANFANIQAWDPTVLVSRKTTSGIPRVGSRFHLQMQFGLRPVPMTYTLEEMQPPSRLVFHGRGQSFRAVDDIRVEPAGEGFRLRYAVRIDFDRSAGGRLEGLIGPLVRLNARRAIKRLQVILGGNDSLLPRLTSGTLLADRLIVPGLAQFTRLGYRLGHRRWPLPPEALAGRRVVLTGGTSGIGLAAAKQLMACGAHITLVGRNPDKSAAVKRELDRAAVSGRLDLEIADLSSMHAVRALAQRLSADHDAIDVLINNAGALFNRRMETSEGYERTLATDLLSPYLLTRLLLPRLKAAAGARIINVASGGMYTQKIHTADLSFQQGPYDGATAYARAKRGLVILSEAWARALKAQGIRVQAMHPGWVDTPGLSSSLPAFYHQVRPLLRSPSQGADTITWLAASPVAGQTSGLFWLDRKPRATHVFTGTRETRAERRRFLQALERMVQPYL